MLPHHAVREERYNVQRRELVRDPRPFNVRFREDVCATRYSIRRHRIHYLFMLPFFLLFFLFIILPIVLSMFLSFTYFNILEPPQWIGIGNYIKLLFKDDIFMKSVKNTLLFAVILGPCGYLLSLAMAWLINELSHGMRVFFTVLFYAPSLTGGMTIIWSTMFSGDSYGYLNGILLNLGIISQPIVWLQDVRYMFGVIVVVQLWMSLGMSFLSFIAGLQGIDRQYYEAAAIDGIKNRWQELWFITLPLMKPQLLFGAVMSITASFGIGDVITQLVGFPSTDYAVHTIMHHLQDYGNMRYEMGYASAIATILSLSMIYSNKLVQKILSRVGT